MSAKVIRFPVERARPPRCTCVDDPRPAWCPQHSGARVRDRVREIDAFLSRLRREGEPRP